jgi:hypothetical protein
VKIAFLAWESLHSIPVGGVAAHVTELAAALERKGHEETTLVAVPVDPYVVQCQWEVVPADIESARRALGVGEQEFWPVLQFYDVTNATRKEAQRDFSFAVGVQLQAGNWFVRSCAPDRAYRADLALKAEDGRFVVIASSNPVQTPPSAPWSYADEQWLPIRLDPQQPESATPMRSLALDLAERNERSFTSGISSRTK